MPSLSEMPELVMENIVGLLDFRSVLTLHQVCKDLLNFIDRLNDLKLPDSGFSRIEMILNEKIWLQCVDVDYSLFAYSVTGNSRSFNGKTTCFKNSNIVDVAIRYLEQVLKFQKTSLDAFSLCILNSSLQNDDSQFLNVLVKLCNMFEKLHRKIKTKILRIKSDSQSAVISILPFADPETLELLDISIQYGNLEIEVSEIVKTEQWKNAKSISCYFYALNMKVENICHLQKFNGSMLSISARDLDFLRKTFLTPSNFKYFILHVKNFNEIKGISSVWGPAFHSVSGYWSEWYFQMKDSEENILRAMICQIDRKIRFDVTEMRHIPNGAIVHDYNEN